MNDTDLEHLRTAIEVARKAREHGNHPFGAILVDENNEVLLQAENTVVTERDCTGSCRNKSYASGYSSTSHLRNWQPVLSTQVPNHVQCARAPSTGEM